MSHAVKNSNQQTILHGNGSAVHLKEPMEVGGETTGIPLALQDMPQGNLRSAVHKSLTKSLPVGFEVGNETDQCGTSRRSKTSTYVALEPIDRGGRRGPDPMPFRVKEEDKVMANQEDSELQLLHVSKGAQKLSQMIDSWSKAPNLDGRSKYFAEDLLRSALDLQESLIMLDKLQNASKRMARMNKNQKPEFMYEREQELEQENSSEALGSKRFGGGCYHNRLQEPRLSVDGSSRNLVEELKKVIEDSLSRQNLLSLCSDDEKTSSIRSYSQSKVSTDKHSNQKVGAVGSIRASNQPKKQKAPSLIAKLMGLEEVPSQTAQPVKKEEKGKNITSPRHSLDIEMPKERKLQVVQPIPDPKRKTLQEIIETMQFKGLLKGNKAEDPRFQPCFPDTPQLQQRARDFHGDDDVPPIVIMKPLHLPCRERGEIHKERTLEKFAVKEDIRSTKLGQEDKVSDHKIMVIKRVERKEVKPMGKIKEKSSPNVKLGQNQQKKEAFMTRKKPNKGQKELFLNEKKREEKKDVKATKMLISPSKTSAAAAKNDKRLAVARNYGSMQTNASQNQNLKCSSKLVAQNFSGCTKEKKTAGAKPVRRSNKAVNNDKKSKEDDKEVNSHNQTDCLSTTSSTFSGDELSEKADQDAEPCNRDDTAKTYKTLCEVIGKINQDGNISGLGEEAIQLSEKKVTTGEAAAIEDDLKLLLLSNQPFFNCAQELFSVDDNRISYYQNKGTDEVGKRDANLFLDIAAELMMRKSHQQKHLIHSSFQTHLWGTTVYYTTDLLVEEISNEIGKLINYNIVDDDATTDSLYTRLERDLKCKDPMINAMWDFGWVDWICMEETDQVAGELGEYVLAWLIEEAAIELIY